MADSKISLLPSLATAADDDLLAIVDTSATETKKIAKSDLVAGLQAELVSGTNIKTINSTSLLGSGDITISGGSPAGTAGQIQFSDGSAFAADSNLFWDNTNKRLGIGTSSPSVSLEVSSGDAILGGAIISTRYGYANDMQLKHSNLAASSSSYAISQNNTGDTSLNSASGRSITLQIGATTNGRYDTNGLQIGNGSTTPTARLQVKGSGSTSATTALLVQNSSGTELLKVTDDGKATMSSAKIGSIEIAYAAITRPTGDQIFFSSNKVIIGSTNTYSSSQLSIDSTSAGFLPPRMTTTQKNAIALPAAGLQLYDSTTSRPCVYTSAWESLTSSDSASPTAVYKFWSGTAAQYAALTPNANTVYFVS